MADDPTTSPDDARVDRMREQGRDGRRLGWSATAETMRKMLTDQGAGSELHQLAAAWLEGYEQNERPW